MEGGGERLGIRAGTGGAIVQAGPYAAARQSLHESFPKLRPRFCYRRYDTKPQFLLTGTRVFLKSELFRMGWLHSAKCVSFTGSLRGLRFLLDKAPACTSSPENYWKHHFSGPRLVPF